MNEIILNVDTKDFLHPPKVVIQKNKKTLIDMPADEFVALLETWISHQETCKA